MLTRTLIKVRGIVQGVGFRPFVYTLARKYNLRGRVSNDTAGVVIEVEGDPCVIERFLASILHSPPPFAHIDAVERRDNLLPVNFPDFRIDASTSTGLPQTSISPDIAMCSDCLNELFDPSDRRYRYPFINCTNCGPRFSIIEGIPFDRAQTTMRDFEMCRACRSEYENPSDRRFHAEPIACPDCGPELLLLDARGRAIPCSDPIAEARELICRGAIVAIKGLGGVHLSCNALDAAAVEGLRQRKFREGKPFAMMAKSVNEIAKYCYISPAEAELLSCSASPIVLLDRKPGAGIAQAVAPGVRTLGFMLPYTPVHHLLFEGLDLPLVMTSGNVSDEPICYENEDALERLRDIADYYLLNNRRIHMRTDDSVAAVRSGKTSSLRRSRGYAPMPIRTAFSFERQVLACGAELKNTFCIARGEYAYLSHHIGDLENVETLRSFTEGIEHIKRLFDLRPEVVAFDLHPEYLSTKYARKLALQDNALELVGVQHHHAHIASCLADNEAEGEVIGVAMDGLGFGSDGKLWGGEFFVADFRCAERIAHLDYIPMPGGAQAVREPWRMAAVYLHRAMGSEFLNLQLPFVESLDRKTWQYLRRMMDASLNCPETSSMGRLFDAVAALMNLRGSILYEAQAAIELETIAEGRITDGYEFEINCDGVIRAEPVICAVVDDLLDGRPAPEVSAGFHAAVAELILRIAIDARDGRGLNRVALSGGVFQNALLFERATLRLAEAGFEVLTHHRVPANDGGISLGQAAVANAR
ncbi:MAG: carbamoyltransferase HypF [Blastocatellales bacterium]|nr:carbamoyltransferase HypF [Blastocatellales bacterium]